MDVVGWLLTVLAAVSVLQLRRDFREYQRGVRGRFTMHVDDQRYLL